MGNTIQTNIMKSKFTHPDFHFLDWPSELDDTRFLPLVEELLPLMSVTGLSGGEPVGVEAVG